MSRRSSKSRVREEDLPENYAELAKRVYAMAEKEGWSKEKTFALLKDPTKLVEKMGNVSTFKAFRVNKDFIVFSQLKLFEYLSNF